jgi:hypothetical protein
MAPAGQDQAAIQQFRFDGMVGGLLPGEQLPQASVAGGATQRRQGTEEIVVEVVLAAGFAQRWCGDVSQRSSS